MEKKSSKSSEMPVFWPDFMFLFCFPVRFCICVIIFSKDTSTPSLGIYSDAMPLIAALYPALIIMFTTLEDYRYGSQEEDILSRSIKFASGSQKGQLTGYTPENDISVFVPAVTTQRETSSISFIEQR
ncbi:hypothetical protein K435DRAFT_236916 [Dendrothele bispora CBS 962.96]|uniref:Uncharacterized protein n=1 Tax=Dendrothele bispora (strain CBS 962.96) TaxID=1314807 RepID=A0A4S8LPD6_DENBC|nr:hypothetical protein K435DRAFT_236916 [Dendrothele bispora CBS 962.96]